jgi:phage baseplate assembly protein gpV
VSSIIPALRALIREELAARRSLELGVVTHSFSNEGGSGENSLQVHVRVRGSATELQRVPVAVGRRGLSAAPRVGDLVVLGFVGGDFNAGIVLGTIYDEQVLPPDAAVDELVYVVPDDAASGKRRFEIALPNDRKLTIEDGQVSIAMGSTSIVIEADGAISIEAGGDMTLKAQGALNLEAGGAATLKGASLSLEGSGEAKLKGSTTTIAGTTNFSAV